MVYCIFIYWGYMSGAREGTREAELLYRSNFGFRLPKILLRFYCRSQSNHIQFFSSWSFQAISAQSGSFYNQYGLYSISSMVFSPICSIKFLVFATVKDLKAVTTSISDKKNMPTEFSISVSNLHQ